MNPTQSNGDVEAKIAALHHQLKQQSTAAEMEKQVIQRQFQALSQEKSEMLLKVQKLEADIAEQTRKADLERKEHQQILLEQIADAGNNATRLRETLQRSATEEASKVKSLLQTQQAEEKKAMLQKQHELETRVAEQERQALRDKQVLENTLAHQASVAGTDAEALRNTLQRSADEQLANVKQSNQQQEIRIKKLEAELKEQKSVADGQLKLADAEATRLRDNIRRTALENASNSNKALKDESDATVQARKQVQDLERKLEFEAQLRAQATATLVKLNNDTEQLRQDAANLRLEAEMKDRRLTEATASVIDARAKASAAETSLNKVRDLALKQRTVMNGDHAQEIAGFEIQILQLKAEIQLEKDRSEDKAKRVADVEREAALSKKEAALHKASATTALHDQLALSEKLARATRRESDLQSTVFQQTVNVNTAESTRATLQQQLDNLSNTSGIDHSRLQQSLEEAQAQHAHQQQRLVQMQADLDTSTGEKAMLGIQADQLADTIFDLNTKAATKHSSQRRTNVSRTKQSCVKMQNNN